MQWVTSYRLVLFFFKVKSLEMGWMVWFCLVSEFSSTNNADCTKCNGTYTWGESSTPLIQPIMAQQRKWGELRFFQWHWAAMNINIENQPSGNHLCCLLYFLDIKMLCPHINIYTIWESSLSPQLSGIIFCMMSRVEPSYLFPFILFKTHKTMRL